MTTAATLQPYQHDLRAALGSQAIAKKQATIVGQTWSDDFQLVPRRGAKYVIAALLQFQIAYTAGAAQAANTTISVGPTTTAVDVLDGGVNALQVSPAPSTNARSYWLSRMGLEETERICLDVRGYSYPRSAPADFAGAGTRTDTAWLIVPIGGPAASLKIQVPSVTAVYSANVTAAVTVTAYVISSDNSTIVTGMEKVTSSLGTGPGQDLSNWYPANMAPDILCFLNETTTSLTNLYITAADGSILLDLQDTGAINTAQSAVVAPDTTYTYDVLDFLMDRKRFMTFLATTGTAGKRQLLFLEFDNGPVTNVAPTAAAIPVTPASTMTGQPLSQGQPIVVASGGSVGVNPAAAAPRGLFGGSGTYQRKRR